MEKATPSLTSWATHSAITHPYAWSKKPYSQHYLEKTQKGVTTSKCNYSKPISLKPIWTNHHSQTHNHFLSLPTKPPEWQELLNIFGHVRVNSIGDDIKPSNFLVSHNAKVVTFGPSWLHDVMLEACPVWFLRSFVTCSAELWGYLVQRLRTQRRIWSQFTEEHRIIDHQFFSNWAQITEWPMHFFWLRYC